MTAFRKGLPPIPRRMQGLPADDRGYPVPFFVAWIDGKPDFRVVGQGRISECHNKKKCWLCGEPMGRFKAFVIGPMCAVNRVSSEPPSHLECAIFAAQACPFLTLPKAQRREATLPDGAVPPAGIGIKRNPGVALIWVTETYKPFVPMQGGGVLFQIGEATTALWFAEGRPATRAEVLESINTGLPILEKMATDQSPAAVAALNLMTARAMKMVPA